MFMALIVIGVLLLLVGWFWLLLRAFASGLLWGWAVLSVVLLPVYAIRHWQLARLAIVLMGLGGLLFVGGGVSLYHSAQQLAPAVGGTDANDASASNIALEGEFLGQPFAPGYAELVDDQLVLREGDGFYASRELRIHLPVVKRGAPINISVLPLDEKPLPELELSWIAPGRTLPETLRVSQGYTLRLNLSRVQPNRLVGDLYLALPVRFQTLLVGEMELLADRLYYLGNRVDTRVNSRETVAYVITDYLQRRFATEQVRLDFLPALELARRSSDVRLRARVDGVMHELEIVLIKDFRGHWQVEGDRFPPLPSPLMIRQATDAVAEVQDRRRDFTLQRLLDKPGDYRHLALSVQNTQGGQVSGRFEGLDDNGKLLIRRRIGSSGSVAFAIDIEVIRHIELLEP